MTALVDGFLKGFVSSVSLVLFVLLAVPGAINAVRYRGMDGEGRVVFLDALRILLISCFFIGLGVRVWVSWPPVQSLLNFGSVAFLAVVGYTIADTVTVRNRYQKAVHYSAEDLYKRGQWAVFVALAVCILFGVLSAKASQADLVVYTLGAGASLVLNRARYDADCYSRSQGGYW